MSRLIVTVPIQLVRDDGGFWLQVEAPGGDSAAMNLSQTGEPLTQGIFQAWGTRVFKEAQLKARRPTGIKDINDKPIFEGDLIRIRHSDPYPSAVGIVTWEPAVAAFVLKGDTEKHGPWEKGNLKGVNRGLVIGNVFEHPDYLVPAEYHRMPNQD